MDLNPSPNPNPNLSLLTLTLTLTLIGSGAEGSWVFLEDSVVGPEHITEILQVRPTYPDPNANATTGSAYPPYDATLTLTLIGYYRVTLRAMTTLL